MVRPGDTTVHQATLTKNELGFGDPVNHRWHYWIAPTHGYAESREAFEVARPAREPAAKERLAANSRRLRGCLI
jgi:hypothetical protein